jgi:hypothetical protein
MVRSWKTKLLPAAGLLTMTAVVSAFLLLETAPAQEEPPEFYVDGARPTREPGRAYAETEGCVPYSVDRSDAHICGDIPDGWTPPARPGGRSQYPDACHLAEAQYELERQEAAQNLPPELLEEYYPEIEASSCYVVPTSRYPGRASEEAEYLVNFAPIRQGAEHKTISLNTD